MLAATIKISRIDYENTLRHIFPVVFEKLQMLNSKKLIVRLFQQLDDAALPVLIGVGYRLPEETKNELLIRGLNAYAPVLKEKLNEELQKEKRGRCASVGTISVRQKDGIILDIDQIDVDYQALMKSEYVDKAISHKIGNGWLSKAAKVVASTAIAVAPGTVEKAELELLRQSDNQNKLLELIRGTIGKYGIEIDIDGIQIMQAMEPEADVIETTDLFILTEEMENDLISALAGFLRSSVTIAPVVTA